MIKIDKDKKVKLQRGGLAIYIDKTRSRKDRRNFVAYACFEYWYGFNEYRKGFEAPIGTTEMDFWNIAPQTIESFVR